MGEVLDAAAVRRWCRLAADALGRTRAGIDALNVFPVPDGDTGTNLHLTLLTAAERLDGLPGDADTADAWRTLAEGALVGARGNSGVILSQMLRGMAEVLGTGGGLDAALRNAADLAYRAVAHPVEGTMLSVLREAAEAISPAPAPTAAPVANPAADAGLDPPGVPIVILAADAGVDAAAVPVVDPGATAWAAAERARVALRRTPDHLDVLARSGVVDAGAAGLCVVLETLAAVVSGEYPETYEIPRRSQDHPPEAVPRAGGGGAYEVMYLLDASEDAVAGLRGELDALGDSLVVVGGARLWNVHVHTDDAGAAIEAGLRAGRPYRIRVTYLDAAEDRPARRTGRGVVAVTAGHGLAALLEEHGARVVRRSSGRVPGLAELTEAIVEAGSEVVVLPDDDTVLAVAEAAARRAREDGVHAAVVPATASVQSLAALAVHDALRRFEDDVIAMTRAAGATRSGRLETARSEAVTSAGMCRPGDILGLVDGDVALIGADAYALAASVLDRMLSPGSELVTLIAGDGAPGDLPDRVRERLRAVRPDVEVAVYHGGQNRHLLLIGVE
ncbi:DAK2 domain-containing protein [Actinoallomurus spadix]|uniref:DAK2 domain-containing protein n=1 Tax=Actinoallomurus spadix TaxID=79912 RepID=A0ABN0XE35_9ACTN|nr:DAK2 domain-containing protein [Actinoallomurus spadix]MCO5989803.1 DAK2 domain-containing protein [Actinoallomurus spadix]